MSFSFYPNAKSDTGLPFHIPPYSRDHYWRRKYVLSIKHVGRLTCAECNGIHFAMILTGVVPFAIERANATLNFISELRHVQHARLPKTYYTGCPIIVECSFEHKWRMAEQWNPFNRRVKQRFRMMYVRIARAHKTIFRLYVLHECAKGPFASNSISMNSCTLVKCSLLRSIFWKSTIFFSSKRR